MSANNESQSLLEEVALLEEKVKRVNQHKESQSRIEAELQKIADGLSLLVHNDEMLLQQFQRNMRAFEQFDPNIFEFFSDYQPRRYFVDIVDGFPNILDSDNNNYLYEYPAYLMTEFQVREYQKSPKSTSAMFQFVESNEPGFIHTDSLNKVLQVLLNRRDVNNGKVRELSKNVNSAMIFGVGCGYHIENLSAKHNINHLYVFEPELDIFYASLFIANWQQILSRVESNNLNIHISLGDSKATFFDELINQSSLYGRYELTKTYGFVHYMTPDINGLLEEFKQRFFEVIHGWGFFDDAVISIGHMLTSIEQGVPLLKKRALIENPLADVPVFIIGNGPSLDKLIDFVKLHRDRAIVVSCGSTLSALYQYGVIPDIHCEQERTSPIIKQLEYYCAGDTEIFNEIMLFGPSTLHPDVFAKFKYKAMAPKGLEPSAPLLMESSFSESFELHDYVNPTVANTAASISVGLGFKNIYFLGIDLAHKDDGNHHSAQSIYYNKSGEDIGFYVSNKLEHEVPGNFGGVFYTDPFFDGSRRMLEKLIAVSTTSSFYNMSDGAMIRGAKPLNLNQVEINNSAILQKKASLRKLVGASSYHDVTGQLYEELAGSLDFNGFESFCLKLITAIEETEDSFDGYLKLLKRHFTMLIDESICEKEHYYRLLSGSVLHMQAMLTQILYEAFNEKDALDDFKQAVIFYKEFLRDTITYYRDNALTPHYYNAGYLIRLEKSKRDRLDNNK